VDAQNDSFEEDIPDAKFKIIHNPSSTNKGRNVPLNMQQDFALRKQTTNASKKSNFSVPEENQE